MKLKVTLALTVLFVALFLIATSGTGLAQPDYTVMAAQTADLGS